LIDENKYLRRIEEKEEKEEEKMYERDWRTGHFSRGEILKGGNVKITESGLSFFYFLFHFYFHFNLFFIVSIFRTLGLGLKVICHTVTSVTSDGVVTTLITELKRRE